MDKVKIIGISGTNGSGKDTAGEILAEKFGFMFVSVTELLREEARIRRLPLERKTLHAISAEWRREYGLGVLIDKALALYNEHSSAFKGLAIASLRNPGEADRVHELGGIVLWIDADAQVRYNRVQANALGRSRAEEDNKSFEQFMAEEQTEMHAIGDIATLDMSAVKAKSDFTILNEYTDKEHLAENLAQTLGL